MVGMMRRNGSGSVHALIEHLSRHRLNWRRWNHIAGKSDENEISTIGAHISAPASGNSRKNNLPFARLYV